MIVELNWKEFANQPDIRILPLNEQVRQYHFYLDALSNERLRQNKGPKRVQQVEPIPSGFLLQENSDYILQEDGSKIYWN